MADLSDTEYLRQVTRRKPEFQQALKRLQDFIPSDFDWSLPARGQDPNTWFQQKREILGHVIQFLEHWRFIDLHDLDLPFEEGWLLYSVLDDRVRKVSCVWNPPPPDGFITLCVSLHATGDEVKRAFQAIKSNFMKEIMKYKGSSRLRARTFHARLQVWDAMTKASNTTFKQVAQTLHKPVSTIKALYWAARRDILGAPSKTRRSKADRQAVQIAQVNFDDTHFKTCSTCAQATTPEALCAPYRAYATQDERPLRERLSPQPESLDPGDSPLLKRARRLKAH